MTGKSSCSSVAPRLSNSSKVWSRAPSRDAAPSRSILLMTTIGRKPIANAFWVTKRVCGIGPSAASTRRRTESTIDSTRSTSPPKSAVPRGVDDVDAVVVPADRRVLRQDRDAAFLLDRVRVHQALGLLLPHVERAGLLQELVDQRRLAVIDVGDDGDVAELLDHGTVSGIGAARAGRGRPDGTTVGWDGRCGPRARARRAPDGIARFGGRARALGAGGLPSIPERARGPAPCVARSRPAAGQVT